MQNFDVTIRNVQHVGHMHFALDLSKCGLTCITGRNSAGKTTLVRALRNLKHSDTFKRTASPSIFRSDSLITYQIDDTCYEFKYDPALGTIDTKEIIDDCVKDGIFVELPLPHGKRFSFIQRSDLDDQLRRSITLEQYGEPTELIRFLSSVYRTSRFDNLKSFLHKGTTYYFLLRDHGYYIREDHLSTGEYFVIQLYRLMQNKCRLIVIDEIDISLDALTQANLVEELRDFCLRFESNIVFTTHSLALMKTLSDGELYQLLPDRKEHKIVNVSYNYIKSTLFGFKGYDKYILTEDEMLEDFLYYLLRDALSQRSLHITIIYVGGANNTIDLMQRNREHQFFAVPAKVLTVLDGDAKEHAKVEGEEPILFIPFEDIEKQLFTYYETGEHFQTVGRCNSGKDLANRLKRQNNNSHIPIFRFLEEYHFHEIQAFREELIAFVDK
ncbi:MAG: AAA family ATPase [Pseudohongiellaceae bacterium]